MQRPPASSSAATCSDDDDNGPSSSDQRAEISDSDIGHNEAAEFEEEIEEEYEEIEVEEEEEIIEEIEVEEEEEEEALDSSKEVNHKSNDVSPCAKFERDDNRLKSCFTLEKSELRLLSNSLVEDSAVSSKISGPSSEPLAIQEESYVNSEKSKRLKSREHLATNEERTSQDSGVRNDLDSLMFKKNSKERGESLCDSKAPLCDIEVVAAETTRPISITQNKVSDALVTKDILYMAANGILDANEEVKPMEMQSENDKKETESRTRSLSPSSKFKDPNKCPAVICDFFAKGWCIRGSSCRFLHVNDKTDNAKEQLEGDAAATNFSKGDQFNEGLSNNMEICKLPSFPDLMASSMGNDTAFSCDFSSERISTLENGEIRRLHQLDDKHTSSSLQREELSCGAQQFPSSKDNVGFSFSSKEVAIDNLGKDWVTPGYGSYASLNGSSPSFQNRLLPERRSSSGSTSSKYRNDDLFSRLSNLGNATNIRDFYMLASSLDGSLSNCGTLPSHQISARTGPSYTFSSSLKSCSRGSQNLLDRCRAYHTSRSSSLLKSAMPLSGSELENLPLTSVSGDPLCYREHKAKISLNDWEPSIPFQPSFLVTPVLASSPGSQYDPLRDSIDLPSSGYRLPFKFSFISQGTSSLNIGPECNDDKRYASCHSRFHENVVEHNCYTPGKDTFANGAVTRGSCVVDGKNGAMPKEENASSTSHFKDVPKTSKIDADCDSRNQKDGVKRKKDFKVDRGRQTNEMEVDQKTDGESRALRHFRTALVDFVKDLLKPTWREGHLSKDAHNTIVKKAVDKVLSTLQPHHIPTTVELARQYLSSSQPKIAKLVEAYCMKYGKS